MCEFGRVQFRYDCVFGVLVMSAVFVLLKYGNVKRNLIVSFCGYGAFVKVYVLKLFRELRDDGVLKLIHPSL